MFEDAITNPPNCKERLDQFERIVNAVRKLGNSELQGLFCKETLYFIELEICTVEGTFERSFEKDKAKGIVSDSDYEKLNVLIAQFREGLKELYGK